MLTFLPPHPDYEGLVRTFVDDFKDHGEEHIYGSGGLLKSDIAVWCRNSVSAMAHKQIQLLTYSTDNNAIIGCVAIRPTLTPELVQSYGCNIGYSIAPSYREQGYGAQQFSKALSICRSLGMKCVFVGILNGNETSRKLIERLGGEPAMHNNDGTIYKVLT